MKMVVGSSAASRASWPTTSGEVAWAASSVSVGRATALVSWTSIATLVAASGTVVSVVEALVASSVDGACGTALVVGVSVAPVETEFSGG